MKNTFGLLLTGIVVLSSCGVFKKKQNLIEVSSESPIFYKNWNYLSARMDVNYSNGSASQNLGLSLRMKKDSIMWFSVSAMLGIQVAKGLMTKDSVWLINIFQREYCAMSMSEISTLLGSKVELGQLQNALVGSCVFNPPTKYSKTTQDEYKGQKDGFINMLNLLSDNSIAKSSLVKLGESSSLTFEYQEKMDVNSFWIPQTVKVNAQSDKKNIQLEMQYKTASDNIITSFPFEVPKGYTKKS